MNDIQERIQHAAESILENEALTADLDDEAAQVLLDWGVEQSQTIAAQTAEMNEAEAEEAMYRPMRALRKMLRITNKWATNPQEKDLSKILKQVEIVYGSSPDVDQQTAFLGALPKDTGARVQALRGFIEGKRGGSNENQTLLDTDAP
jgi:hypothetical protein